MNEVEVNWYRPTDTGVDGALDADVVIYVDGRFIEGEITIALDKGLDRWAGWGDPTHWVSSDLLAEIENAGLDLHDTLTLIEHAIDQEEASAQALACAQVDLEEEP